MDAIFFFIAIDQETEVSAFFLFHPFYPGSIIALPYLFMTSELVPYCIHLLILFFLFIFQLSKTLEVNVARRKWIYFTAQFEIKNEAA